MKPSLAAPLAALALALASPSARADDTRPSGSYKVTLDPEPAPEETLERFPPPLTRLKLIAAGVIVTGLAWGVSFTCAQLWPYVPNATGAAGNGLESGPPGTPQLKIPIVGPWIMLGHSGCAPDDPGCAGTVIGVRDTLLVIDGIVQAAGIALIVEGIVMSTSPEKKKSMALRLGGFEMTPVPVLTPSMTGLGVGGTF